MTTQVADNKREIRTKNRGTSISWQGTIWIPQQTTIRRPYYQLSLLELSETTHNFKLSPGPQTRRETLKQAPTRPPPLHHSPNQIDSGARIKNEERTSTQNFNLSYLEELLHQSQKSRKAPRKMPVPKYCKPKCSKQCRTM